MIDNERFAILGASVEDFCRTVDINVAREDLVMAERLLMLSR